MQSKKLMRDIFTEPPPEANLPAKYILQILLPHYGLVQSGSCFSDAYYPVYVEKLKMKPAAQDPYLFSKVKNDILVGLTGLATDDSLNTENHFYQLEEEKAISTFITKTSVKYPFRFLGTLIERTINSLSVVQDLHIQKLSTLDIGNIDHNQFRSTRSQLLFLSQSSRPDICYDVAKLCQVPFGTTTKKDVKLLNEVFYHVQKNSKLEAALQTT